MGFPEALVRSTLESVGGDENMALEKLALLWLELLGKIPFISTLEFSVPLQKVGNYTDRKGFIAV